jgi:hypothetical protein
MTDVAIFSCNHASPADIQTHGTTCHRIMTLGAPAEWFYALTTVSWSLTIAFDIYITPIISEVKSIQDQADVTELLAHTEQQRETTDTESPEMPGIAASLDGESSYTSRSSSLEFEKDRHESGGTTFSRHGSSIEDGTVVYGYLNHE